MSGCIANIIKGLTYLSLAIICILVWITLWLTSPLAVLFLILFTFGMNLERVKKTEKLTIKSDREFLEDLIAAPIALPTILGMLFRKEIKKHKDLKKVKK